MLSDYWFNANSGCTTMIFYYIRIQQPIRQ